MPEKDTDPTIIHADVQKTHVSRLLDTVTKWDRDKREARSFKELEPDLEAFLNGKTRKKKTIVDTIGGIDQRIVFFEMSQPRVLPFTDAKDIDASIEWYANPTEPLPGLSMEQSVVAAANRIRYDVKRLYEARDVYNWLTIGMQEMRLLESAVYLSLGELDTLRGLLHSSLGILDKDFEPEVMQTLVAYRKEIGLAQDKGCSNEEIEAKIREDNERKDLPGFKLGYCVALLNQIKNGQDGQTRENTLTGRRTSMQFLRLYNEKLQSQLADMGRDFIDFYEGTIKGLAAELGVVADDGRITRLKEMVESLEPGKKAGYSFSDLKGIVASLGRALSVAVPPDLKGRFQYKAPQETKPVYKAAARPGTQSALTEDDAIAEEQRELNNKVGQLFYGGSTDLYMGVGTALDRLGDKVLSLGAAANEDASDYTSVVYTLRSGLYYINQGLEEFIGQLVNDPGEILARGFLIRREHALKLGEDLGRQNALLESLCDNEGNPLPGNEQEVRQAETERESIRQLFLYRANFLVAQLYGAKRWYGFLREIRELADPAKQAMLNSKIEGLYRKYNRLINYLNEGREEGDRIEFWVASESDIRGLAVNIFANIGQDAENQYRQELESQLGLLHNVISVCETLADSRKKVVDSLRVQKYGEEELLEEGSRRFVADYIERSGDENENLRINLIRDWKRLTGYEEVAGGVKLSDDDVIGKVKEDTLTPNIDDPAVRRRVLVYNLQVFRTAIRQYAHLGRDVCKAWREFEEYQEEREKLTQAVSSLSGALRAPTADKPYNPQGGEADE